MMRLPKLAPDAHKGEAGRVLCVAGSRTMPGAAILVARSAQRAGAGLCAVACLDANLLAVLPVAAPEAILMDWQGLFDGPGADVALFETRAPHARLLGPGLGEGARTRALLCAALAVTDGVPLVLDADGLNALDGEPERLRAYAGTLVITPHPGEAARLLGHALPRDRAGRKACALELARRGACICCLKGAGTIVTDGDEVYVNAGGNPGMASAGSGDVLAGILVAYLALGRAAREQPAHWTPFEAAKAAVFTHAGAGDAAALAKGQRGLIASDLIDFLPAVQRELEQG